MTSARSGFNERSGRGQRRVRVALSSAGLALLVARGASADYPRLAEAPASVRHSTTRRASPSSPGARRPAPTPSAPTSRFSPTAFATSTRHRAEAIERFRRRAPARARARSCLPTEPQDGRGVRRRGSDVSAEASAPRRARPSTRRRRLPPAAPAPPPREQPPHHSAPLASIVLAAAARSGLGADQHVRRTLAALRSSGRERSAA